MPGSRDLRKAIGMGYIIDKQGDHLEPMKIRKHGTVRFCECVGQGL